MKRHFATGLILLTVIVFLTMANEMILKYEKWVQFSAREPSAAPYISNNLVALLYLASALVAVGAAFSLRFGKSYGLKVFASFYLAPWTFVTILLGMLALASEPH